MAYVREFFKNGNIPSGCNSSFITLVHKVENPLVVSDFHPISLIGAPYKILAKILANRLSRVIDSLISTEQTAFIKSRQILDGPLMVNEIINLYKKRKQSLMIFKVDFEKAFDSVSWDFLDRIMGFLGFGCRWIGWIGGCLNSAKASVLINGSDSSDFSLHRGLRQGDPLSPFLFILVMEALHVAVEDAINVGLYRGVQIAWNSVLASKVKGDLSIGSLGTLNLALFQKWSWRFFNSPQALWVKVVLEIHGSYGTVGSVFLINVEVLVLGLGLWGQSTPHDKANKDRLVRDKWQNGWVWCWTHNFNGGVTGSQLDSLTSMLVKVHLTEGHDDWHWSLIGSNIFTVRDTRIYIDSISLLDFPIETRWCRFIPGKVNILVWRALRDRTPTHWNLSRKGIEVLSLLYPLCNISPETSAHLFWSCSDAGVGIAAVVIVVVIKIGIIVYVCNRRSSVQTDPLVNDSRFIPLTMVKFLDDMEREKPIRFTSQQLRIATENFTVFLGSGGFGTVYKGIFSNGTTVAVKVLNGSSDKRIEEQFMAEVSTMGRTHHFNLVRLYGFCFESSLRALVYEFMVNGSLDNHLFKAKKEPAIGFQKLHEIAVGTARGIAYLHEECALRIVHYDIKPGNVLLDSRFCAKVADFGLAKLCNRDNTHITMTGGRGTPGYAAPELWLPLPVTHKCDVYSFGMLLFEIIGRRKNMDVTLVEENDQKVVEWMLKVALCCVQYRPETRPVMSIVVKMLEGALEVPEPLNPFAYLYSGVNEPDESLARLAWNGGGSDWSSSEVVTKSTVVTGTPLMRRYEITMASE
nr:G-type lectin S-receptor-like serine/threonine-protein kinase At1g34300 [Tanacetum cinerariifolium]